MSKPAPIVAELGRPETPEETAARKAEATKNYRSSQTMRNLLAALLVTLAMVAIIIFAVPRGEPLATPGIDLDRIAADVKADIGVPVIVPDLADDWQVNSAELRGGSPVVWDIVLAPRATDQQGFIHVAQAFQTDKNWAAVPLMGTAAAGTVDIDGRTWDEFTVRDPENTANISYALGTQAGDDYVLLYGRLSKEETADLARSLESQIASLAEGA